MLNLIFDLDETLINSRNIDQVNSIYNVKGLDFFYINFKMLKKNNKTKKNKIKSKTKKKIIKKNEWIEHKYIIFQRTNLKLFLKFCFKHFNVGFWTNGNINYGKAIIKNLLTPEERKKCFCLIYRTDYDSDYMYYKDDIKKKKFKINATNGRWSKKLEYVYNKKITNKNTILFDDGLYNKAMNCKNTILIPVFKYNIENDQCLFKLMKYLDKIKKHKKIGNLKIIQNKLFKDYKINKHFIKQEIYKEGDNIWTKETIKNSKDNNIIISKVNKKTYTVLYINKNNKELEEKNIKHTDVHSKIIRS